MSRSLSILHIVAPTDVGGLESVVRLLAIGQQARGHRVHVAAVLDGRPEDSPFCVGLKAAGVSLKPLTVSRRGYLSERWRVRALCRELKPDVVHTHGYRPDIIDGPVARRAGIPTVTTVHGFTGGGWKNQTYERMQRRGMRSFDGVVAVSRQLVARLAAAGVTRNKLHLVPNGYTELLAPHDFATARAHLSLPEGRRMLGIIARLGREKGVDVLLEALASVSPDVLLSVVGDGAERDRLENLARTLGVRDRVTFHGAQLDAGRLITAFDVFVLSSRTEGTPMVLFEAMAAGVPIVTSSVGGIPDVLGASSA
ncbi:MAG: glycosyltransferase, partial [Gemmatimonadota bacterium]|nr:glycosyltransferase [Gemmatimonadota bacterium]